MVLCVWERSVLNQVAVVRRIVSHGVDQTTGKMLSLHPRRVVKMFINKHKCAILTCFLEFHQGLQLDIACHSDEKEIMIILFLIRKDTFVF